MSKHHIRDLTDDIDCKWCGKQIVWQIVTAVIAQKRQFSYVWMKLSFRNNTLILHYCLYWNVSFLHHGHFSSRKGDAGLQGGNEILCWLKITSSVNLDDKVSGLERPQGKESPQFLDKWFSVWQRAPILITRAKMRLQILLPTPMSSLSVCLVCQQRREKSGTQKQQLGE